MTSSKVRLDLFDSKVNLNRGKIFWVEMIWYLIKIFFFLSYIPYPNQLKVFLLKLFGAKVGKKIIIKPNVNILFPWKLSIGDYVWIGEGVRVLNFESITIGCHVCISQNAFLCGGNHDYKKPEMEYKNGTISLSDGCWVGANVFVGPNVNIGYDTVVTAGSVVTRELQENAIYSGNPARFIKKRWV